MFLHIIKRALGGAALLVRSQEKLIGVAVRQDLSTHIPLSLPFQIYRTINSCEDSDQFAKEHIFINMTESNGFFMIDSALNVGSKA